MKKNSDLILFHPISNALQWRLQYQRIVDLSENVKGITKIVHKKKN